MMVLGRARPPREEAGRVTEEGFKLGRADPNNRLNLAIRETERIEAILDEQIGGYWDNLWILLGFIPNGTRRIGYELPAQTPQDACAIFHASRVFTTATAALIVLRRGMLVEANTLIRSTLEVVAQSVLFLRDAADAEKWMGGKRYKPGEVRKRLGAIPDFAPLYDELSSVAHPNPEAVWTHAVSIPNTGFAVAFGGTYQPKRIAELLAVLVDLILLFMRAFYTHYIGRLSIDFWPIFLDAGSAMNAALRDWTEKLPHDWDELVPTILERGPEPPMPPPPIPPTDYERALNRMRELRDQDVQSLRVDKPK
jgi:hypothetical protein